MGYNNPDVYYQPEAFGLTPIGQLDDPDADWSFDIFAVWKHEETGKIYYGENAGCSCPSPFEDYTKLEDLTEVISMHDFIDDVKEYFNSLTRYANGYGDDDVANWDSTFNDNKWNVLKADAIELIRKVRES